MQTPEKILQHLWAFWQHFGIHKRVSDYSKKNIISVFSPYCPYPVWHYDEWIAHSNPPSSQYDTSKDFWQQTWEIFSQSPIPHNVGIWNQNAEYADDCWYSKNIYLCHSLFECEDIKYCFRVVWLKNCQFCVFSFESELCVDLIYGFNCYNLQYAIDVKRCKNSAFLFDCQDCEDCFLCWNLRNKRYCILNKQYTKEEYLKEREKYNLNSKQQYKNLKNIFSQHITKQAWWKAIHFEKVENSTGDYLNECKNCESCFYIDKGEDSSFWVRSHGINKGKYFISAFHSENIYYSTLAQDHCYNIAFCSNVVRSKNLEYCMNCFECENCFLCNGLVQKKYYIFNKQFEKESFEIEKQRIIDDMKQKGVYGQFFPPYFAPTWYNESLSWVYDPLSLQEQKELWYRIEPTEHGEAQNFKSIEQLPDILWDESVEWGYWDAGEQRPFQILADDIIFYKKVWVPVNDMFYIRRLKENFTWMFSTYSLRKTQCAWTGKEIFTVLPQKLDGRILSQEAYEKEIY